MPPARFVVYADGREIASSIPTIVRIDGVGGSGKASCVFDLNLDLFPSPLDCRFEIHAVDHDGMVASVLPKLAGKCWLDGVVIRSAQDFVGVIQNPASRIRDEATLLYGAIHCVRRIPDDYVILAAAICEVGYRLLHDFKCEPEIADLLREWIERFAGWESPLEPGPTMQWQIAVWLMAAYLALSRGDFCEAEAHLRAVADKATTLALCPSQLTNILLGIYGLGYLSHGRSDDMAALASWERAERVFRTGWNVTQFSDDYTYIEVGNALKVARECHLGRFVIAAGRGILNTNIAAKGAALDPTRIPEPLGRLLPPLKDLSKDALIEAARRSSRAQQWSEAERRIDVVRRWFPDCPFGYSRGGDALRELRRFDDAETVLSEGIRRFPEDADSLRAHARLAQACQKWTEAARRWEVALGVKPEDPDFWRSAIDALARAGLAEMALQRSQEALQRFPDNPDIIEVAARVRQNRKEFDIADDLLVRGMARFPQNVKLLAAYAWVAHARGNRKEVIQRWTAVRDNFPDHAAAYSRLGRALRLDCRLAEAEGVLQSGMEKFPADMQIAIAMAWLLNARQDWTTAVERWQALEKYMPDNTEVASGLGAARWGHKLHGALADETSDKSNRATEISTLASTSYKAPAQILFGSGTSKIDMSDLMMQFESIGTNCEFGFVQRRFGAEPLGLFRWAGLTTDGIINILKSDFSGIGDPAQTELTGSNEFDSCDTVFGMVTHTFIQANQKDRDKVFLQQCSRLRYLKRNFQNNLRISNRIYVYKNNFGTSNEKLLEIVKYLNGYAGNMLLHVKTTADKNAIGTVDQIEDRLLIGYIDKYNPSKDLNGSPIWNISYDVWRSICTRAHALWR